MQAEPGGQRTIGTPNCALRVRSSRSESLAWLAEFLSPAFGPTSAEPDFVIDFRAGGGVYTTWRRGVRALRGTTQCFTLDAGRDCWSRARDAAGETWAHDEAARVALHVQRSERPVNVRILAEREQPDGRAALMRVARECASREALSRGSVPVHASAVANGGGVTLFAGRKRSGKSTLLLYALRCGDVRFVSNDRVLVRGLEAAVEARGMPSITRLREGTLDLHPRLASELGSGAWHYPVTVAECEAHRRAGSRVEPGSSRPIPGLSPAQCCALLGVRAAAGGPLSRVVFPAVDVAFAETSGFRIERLDPGEAAERWLRDGLLARGRVSPWLTPDPESTRIGIEGLLPALAQRIPTYACTLGPRAYDSQALWKALCETPATH